MPGTFYSCYYHISLKIITLSFSHTTPVTLAKHVYLQSTGTRAWRRQRRNCPLQDTVTLSLSHSAPCTTSCTESHPSHPAFLMVLAVSKQSPLFSAPLRHPTGDPPFSEPDHLSGLLTGLPASSLSLHEFTDVILQGSMVLDMTP